MTTTENKFDEEGIFNEKDQKLEELWKRIRLFLSDEDGLGNKIELKKGMQPTRIKFMEACFLLNYDACQRYADPK